MKTFYPVLELILCCLASGAPEVSQPKSHLNLKWLRMVLWIYLPFLVLLKNIVGNTITLEIDKRTFENLYKKICMLTMVILGKRNTTTFVVFKFLWWHYYASKNTTKYFKIEISSINCAVGEKISSLCLFLWKLSLVSILLLSSSQIYVKKTR